MRKIKNKIAENKILFFSLIYFTFYMLGGITLFQFHRTYLLSFSIISVLGSLIGILVGTIKGIQKIDCPEKAKRPLYILYSLVEGSILIVVGFFLFLQATISGIETRTIVDGKAYYKKEYSFLFANRIDYYDIESPIWRKTQVRIEDEYDDSLSESDFIGRFYYDDNGKRISNTSDKKEQQNLLESSKKEELEIPSTVILYQETFSNIQIRIIRVDTVLPQKDIIIVEKSTDSGKTYQNQLKEEYLSVQRESHYVFLNGTIGFINEPVDNESRGLLVTRDGGVTFESAIFNVEKKELEYLYLENMPYYEGNTIKVRIYNAFTSKEENFISEDNGLSWEKE